MAKKKASRSEAGRRQRRTPEQIIAALQEQIESVKRRAAVREMKGSPAMQRTVTILRNINKAMGEAADERNSALQHALADAYKALAVHLESQGVPPPKARLPRGRRPRS